jgi:hypothetical protein
MLGTLHLYDIIARMKKGFIYTIIIGILVVGTLVTLVPDVSAQTLETARDIPTSIVSCSGVEGADGLPPCNWCSFVQLIGNLIKYAIFLAVTLSSLMFAYAGFLFLTNNGNPTKVIAAWEIFRRTIYGIIGILAAWLIVNAIMTKIAGNEEWMSLECADVSIESSYNGDIDNVPGPYDGYNAGYGEGGDVTSEDYNAEVARREEERRLAELERKRQQNIATREEEDRLAQDGLEDNAVDPKSRGLTPEFTKGYYCTDNEYGCRYLDGVKERTVSVVNQLKQACGDAYDASCASNIRVTRAAEPNRDESFEDNDPIYNYRNGYKINLNARSGLTQYMTTNLERMGQTSEGHSVYRDKCGNEWKLMTYPNASRSAQVKGEWVGTIKYSVPADTGSSCF